ncbi:MAG: zinc-binding alcohol dehydrogenase family protein [Cytophagales bacterium]|uniref:zinc-binding alcohol dehydrogenase family protein n=1 Tax=Cyclobacterium marinum TaxID=104 RepID=UPI0011EECB32|nr:zinc-binding alcohol dehydrogenase family protein [Cyclobacterium marinum]MBI0400329.1 zinc-binding alcohol dehydrogenase family protein [Cyclobacterium marinum]MBR9775484.1 zinc-binding alcohol dehydrogenase family protein [Cytophagales bacterium]|tara:strand:- start:91732 stop:92739 length:1008 start_codon:yes stop_codon:yes gene_type:complete
MKIISCERPGEFESKETEVPQVKGGEVLVRIQQLGVCGTDLHAFAGNQAFFTYPRILGHEIAAKVVDANGSSLKAGAPVVVIPYLNCGDCGACKAGKTNCCEKLEVLGVHIDGAMQEYMALPESILLPTPQLTWDEMAIVEPLSVASHAVKRAGINKGDKVLVMGCGPIGLAIMVFATLAGAEVTALDINPWRLNLAKTKFNAIHSINALEIEKIVSLKETYKNQYQFVFDATGNKRAMEAGPYYAAHGGSYILVGLYKDQLSFHHPSIHAKELSILCSRNATKEDFLEVINTLAQKQFPTADYTTNKFGFTQTKEKFPELTEADNQVIKALINF